MFRAGVGYRTPPLFCVDVDGCADKQLLFWGSNSGSAILFYAIVATFIMTGGEVGVVVRYGVGVDMVDVHEGLVGKEGREGEGIMVAATTGWEAVRWVATPLPVINTYLTHT